VAESRRLRWPYPNQYVDPWYDAFESLVDAMDASAYTVREDRSSVLMSTATVSFNVSGADGVLTWNAPIELLAPLSGFLLSVSAGTATLRDGELLYMQVVRAPTANITVSFNVARAVPNTDDCLLMAIRRGSTVYWRDGKVINHGESVQLFSTSGGGGGGGAFIKQDGTNSPTADISWANFKLTDLAPPSLAGDAANKNYVDGFLKRDGTNAPTADIPWNAKKITNLLDPTSAQDAATKNYVDSAISGAVSGLYWKDPVRVATTQALNVTQLGNVLTSNVNGAINTLGGIDGVTTLALNDRVLVKDPYPDAGNGIFIITDLGSGGTPFVLTRAADANTSAEVREGMACLVRQGNVNQETAWSLQTPDPITLNTTALTFVQVPTTSNIIWRSTDLWETVYAKAIAARPCSILIPGDAVARYITAGVYNLQDIELVGASRDALGQRPAVIVNDGVDLGEWLHAHRVSLSFQCTTTPAMAPIANLDLEFRDCLVANAVGATVVPIEIPAAQAGYWMRLYDRSRAGDLNFTGTALVRIGSPGGSLNVVAFAGTELFTRFAVTSGTPAFIELYADDTLVITAPSVIGAGITPTFNWLSVANQTSYSPSTPANWSPPPVDVAGALDQTVTQIRQVIAGTGLSGGGALSSNVTLTVVYGTTAGTAAEGNDSRIVNAVPNSRTLTGQSPVAIDGAYTAQDLTANRTISLAVAGQMKGDFLYFDGTDWTRFAAGTAGYVLQTNGAGNDPSYVPQIPVQRAVVADQTATNQTSGAPLYVATFYYDPAEWVGIGSGKSLYFEAVLSVDNALYTATLRVYNRTAGGYVAPANGTLTNNTTSPTLIVGTGVAAAVTNFDPTVAAMLQFELYIDNALGSAVLGHAQIVVK
jgi:hypothetical protein